MPPQWTMRSVSIEHYENFPVASLLCPARLRPAVRALYVYARTADDLADEGEARPAQRLAALAAYRADLEATLAGRTVSPRWPGVFEPLGRAITAHGLPAAALRDLLGAFEQDIVKHRYADRADLLDYCRRSANPVGRLLLHLYGIDDATSLRESDAVCTALQLINFWQDFGVDTRRGRLYVPLADCQRHGVRDADLLAGRDSTAVRALVADETAWARALMQAGAPLALRLPGRIGWELRFVVQGGLRVLDKIERSGHAALLRRPVVQAADGPLLAWRALTMRAARAGAGAHAA